MKYNKIVNIYPNELIWPFESGNDSFPYYQIKNILNYYHKVIRVDPFPCTGHDENIIKNKIKEVESKFPISAVVRYIILPNEVTGRTNAWASKEWIDEKYKDKEFLFEGYVILSGKRTIVHPAMSNYLIAHEYGHIVDYWITSKMNKDLEKKNESIFREEYAKMRNINSYGGGRWKDNIGEIIADDFRIVVAQTDVDFYVHSCKHPLKSKSVINFWNKMIDKYSLKNK